MCVNVYLSGNEELPMSRKEEAVPPPGKSRLIWGFISPVGMGGALYFSVLVYKKNYNRVSVK